MRKKAVGVYELEHTNFNTMPFAGKWEKFVGSPATTGAWIIWGNSGNGKTRFALQLAKYLCKFEEVFYDTLEEGVSLSFQKAVIESNMRAVSGRFKILDKEPLEVLKERLKSRRSPRVVIIDSIQYTGLNKASYKALRQEFPNKLFIFISHADGKNPEGRFAKSVRYDVDVKIRIEGFRAFAQSRFGGGEPFTIWEDGASKYYNEVN